MKGLALCDLEQEKFEAALTGILFHISVISGCTLPTHDAHINALEKEFGLFLKNNGYDEFTTDEVLIAFRFNAAAKYDERVESYGHLFSMDYAGKVLRLYETKSYVMERKLVDHWQESERVKRLNEEEDRRRRKVISQFERYLKDENAELDLSDCYMQLNTDGAFANRSFDNEFMSQAKIETKRTGETVFKKALLIGGIDIEASFTAGKLAVKFLFEQMKKTGRLKIYDDKMVLLYPGFFIPEAKVENDEF